MTDANEHLAPPPASVLVVRPATRADLPEVLRLLRDDVLRREPDGDVGPQHLAAFDAIEADPDDLLVVGEARRAGGRDGAGDPAARPVAGRPAAAAGRGGAGRLDAARCRPRRSAHGVGRAARPRPRRRPGAGDERSEPHRRAPLLRAAGVRAEPPGVQAAARLTRSGEQRLDAAGSRLR
nr:hypothetical protein [Angustibacter aerolatus]